MTVKKEVHELVKQLRILKTDCPEWKRICDILRKKYKMSAFAILALYANPPVLEYTIENMHLVLEAEE